jgi:hypothetical protein
MAAAAFSGGSYLSLPPERGRLKAGCGQNCPPHKLCEPGCTFGHSILYIRNFLDDVLAPIPLVSLYAGAKDNSAADQQPLMSNRAKLLFSDDLLNTKGGHVCRVTINPSGFVLNNDGNPAKQEKGVALATVKTPLNEGQWYTMLVEVQGGQLPARIDDSEASASTTESMSTRTTSECPSLVTRRPSGTFASGMRCPIRALTSSSSSTIE